MLDSIIGLDKELLLWFNSIALSHAAKPFALATILSLVIYKQTFETLALFLTSLPISDRKGLCNNV